MIQIFKFIAVSLGFVFSGTNAIEIETPPIDNNEIVTIDTLKLEPHRIKEKIGHTCGYNHAVELMKQIDPEYEAKMKFYDEVILPAIQKEAKQRRKSGLQKRAEVLSIPIVFHIIHKPGQQPGSGENLDDQTIIDQLETLNEDFSALNPGWANIPDRWADIKGNPEIKFCLAEFDPQGNPTSGITRHEYNSVTDANIQSVIKPATFWPTQDYYNVWTLSIPGTTAQGGVAGYAYLPYPGTPGSNFDGTVLDYRFTGKGSRTLSHEIGHGFGLKHTWGNSGGCGDDDGIEDTPLQASNTNSITYVPCNGTSWPTGPSTCNSLEHMYINYMDYVPSACRTTFSQGQVDVMRSVALGGGPVGTNLNWASRNQLVQNAPNVAPVCNVGTPTGGGNPNGGGPVITLEFDAGIQLITNPSGGEFCGAQMITPTVILTNDVGDTPLTKCTIRYKITGIPGSTPFQWSGNLEKGENEVVTLAPFMSPDFNFEFTAWTSNPNDEQDENGFNDEKVISLVTPTVYEPSIFEDFEDETALPTSTRIKRVSPGTTIRRWELSDNSAYGVGNSSVFFRNFLDPNGDGAEDILEFPILDFAEIENPRLAFDIAYYNINNFSNKDSLRIRVSTDCGESFTTVFYEGGADLATVSQQQPAEFFPTPVQWRNEVVDLFSYAGSDRMLIEIVNIGYGNNNLYLDNINLSDGCASNVQVVSSNLTCADECDGFINLILNGFVEAPQITWSNNVSGQEGESLDDLCAGDYSVTVYDTEFDCEFIQDIEITSPEELKLIVNGTDISIPGADNGSVNAQGFGGTGFITYEWDFITNGTPETEPFIFGLNPGIYCVTATDQAGCSLSDCVQIFGFECEMEVSLDIVQPTCGGSDIGSGVVTVINAVGTPTVIWSQGGPFGFVSGETNNNLTPQGGSFVIITDTGLEDCQEEFYFEIFPAVIPMINPVVVDETGAGNSDGSITLNLEEGDSQYSIAWSSGPETTEKLTMLTAGFYTVTISDDNNDCELVETFEIKNLNCTLTAGTTIKNVTCFDGTDGELEVMASGGTPPYIINWPSGPNVVKQTNLKANIYPITVVDDAGCRLIVEAIISQPAPLTITLSKTDESTAGALDGSVTASVVGGTKPYQYAWSNSTTGSATISGLGGGIYLVTVTDANGCQSVKGASVEGKVCPNIVIEADPQNVSCFNVEDGSITVVVSGGVEPYNYVWTPGGANSNTIENLPAGDYNIAVLDAEGCPANATITITEPAEFSVSLIPTNESTAGMMDGSVESSITGGVGTLTYNWTGPVGFDANTPNISFLNPGEYCLTVTDETECSAVACVSVTAGENPCDFTDIVVEFSVENETILGEEDGSLLAIVTGSNTSIETFSWTDNNGGTYSGNPIDNLAPGEYIVTVTDANECSGEGFAIILEGTDPCFGFGVEISGSEPIACKGDETGSANVNVFGGLEPYDYLWNNDTELASLENIGAGTYMVTVTDANDCTISASVVIDEPVVALDLSTTGLNETTTGANNGSASAALSGGEEPYTYIWSGPNGYASSDAMISNLAPGEYCVIATDANMCSLETCTTILPGGNPCEGVEILVEIAANELGCDGQPAIATYLVEGGQEPYEVVWSNDESTPSIEAITAGEISITVTDANGCIGEANYIIEEPIVPEVELTPINPTSAISLDGSASVTVTPADESYIYIWSINNGEIIGNGSTIGDLSIGDYTIQVINELSGCSQTIPFTLTADEIDCSAFEIFISGGDVSCNGFSDGLAQVEVANGQEPFTIIWSDSDTEEFIRENLVPGPYQVTVTDANGCSATEEIEIDDQIVLDLMIEVIAISSPTAMDGSMTAIVSGGMPDYSYLWSVNNDNQTIDNLGDGEYCVTVTDSNGCSITACETLEEINIDCSEFDVELVYTNQISCFEAADGGLQVNIASAVEPVTFMWSNDLADIQQQTNLDIGNYSVTVTDANGCVYESSLEITQPESELTIELSSLPSSGVGIADGSATVVAVGGNIGIDYTYIWSDATSQTTSVATDLTPGEYCVTVGSGSCSAVDCIEVLAADDPCADFVVNFEITDVSCFGACDGSVELILSGGTGPYLYNWSSAETGESIENSCAGPGGVTITDSNNCSEIITFIIEEPADIDLFVSATNATSVNSNDGTVSAAAFGGTPPFSYVWNNMEIGSMLIDMLPGNYEVTATDANDCSIVGEVSVGVGSDDCEDFQASLEIENVSCFGAEDALITLTVEGGSGFYFYDWSNGNSLGITQGNVGAGDFTVLVTDENDCELLLAGTVLSPDELLINIIDANNTSGENMNDGSIEIEVIGGEGPYVINWADGFGNVSEVDGLAAGNYIVVAEDANGCQTDVTITIEDGTTSSGNCDDLIASFIITPVSCFGEADGKVEVTASGGTPPYDISSSVNSFTDLPATNVTISVEDADGCIFEELINIGSPNQLTLNPRGFDGTCGASAFAEVVIIGGTPPFNALWSNQETGPIITNLDGGTYTVEVTDANGCTSEGEVTVQNDFLPLDFEVSTRNANCANTADGAINVKINEGLEPITYLWNDGITTKDRENISAGIYTLNMTDAAGCEYVFSRTILAPSALNVSYTVQPGATSALFDVTINVSGGTPSYQFNWDDGSNNFINVGIGIGTYTVIVSDSNGCEQAIDVVVDGSTAVRNQLDVISEFNLSPNPTNGDLFLDVTLNKASQINISIFNILGQSIFDNSYSGLRITERLDLKEQPSGTYIVRLHNESGQSTKKFIKVD